MKSFIFSHIFSINVFLGNSYQEVFRIFSHYTWYIFRYLMKFILLFGCVGLISYEGFLRCRGRTNPSLRTWACMQGLLNCGANFWDNQSSDALPFKLWNTAGSWCNLLTQLLYWHGIFQTRDQSHRHPALAGGFLALADAKSYRPCKCSWSWLRICACERVNEVKLCIPHDLWRRNKQVKFCSHKA